MKALKIASIIAALTSASHALSAPVTVGSFTFDETAFADTASVVVGSVVDIATLVGSDLDTILLANTPGSIIEFGFTDNTILNVVGFDVFLFELGQPENSLLSLSAAGPGIPGVLLESIAVNNAGTTIHTFGYELTDLGIAAGSQVPGEPDLVAIATRGEAKAISAPSAFAIFVSAVGALLSLKRRRRRTPAG